MVGNISFLELAQQYRELLLDGVMPFWANYTIDMNGGINSCVKDDGTIVSRDRWGWSQWRGLWVFSRLSRRFAQQEEWRKIADGIFEFETRHGPLDDGRWALLQDGDGVVLRGSESLYTDAFALLGLSEYWQLSGNQSALDQSYRTFQAIESALLCEDRLSTWPYPTPPGCKPHGLSMILSQVYHEFAIATSDCEALSAAMKQHSMVMNQFLSPQSGVVREWLKLDGTNVAPPLGSVVCPGHAIESMWFQIHIAQSAGDDATVRRAADAVLLHLERGWDQECGGLFLAIDADGRDEVQWQHADYKLWWPHVEALYATLLSYEVTQDSQFLKWHEKIREYSFSHFPSANNGEWRQKLDRFAQPVDTVVALPVKDPFHLPRSLIYCIDVLERLATRN